MYAINVVTLNDRRGRFGRSLCQCFIAGAIEIIQRDTDRGASIIAFEGDGMIRILGNGGISVGQVQRRFVAVRILQLERRLVAGIGRIGRRIGRRIQFVVDSADGHCAIRIDGRCGIRTILKVDAAIHADRCLIGAIGFERQVLGIDGDVAIVVNSTSGVDAVLEIDAIGQGHGGACTIGFHSQIIHIHCVGVLVTIDRIRQSGIGALGEQGPGIFQLAVVDSIGIGCTCRHIVDLLAAGRNAAAGEFRTTGQTHPGGIHGILQDTCSVTETDAAAAVTCPVELDGFLIAVAATGAQLGGVQLLEVAGQLDMECVGIFVGYDSDVIAGELGRIHGIGRRAIRSRGGDGVTAASDGDGFIGATGHDVLIVCRSSLAEAGIVAAEADLAGQRIELGAVDGVGAGGADKASRYVLDTALRADTADGDDASRVAAGIGVAHAIAVCFICIVRIHAGSRAFAFHGLHSQLI